MTTTHEIAKAMLAEPDRSARQNCLNCFHRKGIECARTGWMWEVEMRVGNGQCHSDGKLLLWEPKPKRAGFWRRLFGKD